MRFPVWASNPLKHVYRALCLVALLVVGQQGAVMHELGHLAVAQTADVGVSAGEPAEGNCVLCPLFAQVATAAFSHAFLIPLPVRAAPDRTIEIPVEAVDAAVPTPRIRGPPSLS
jgi:hypothetical protein